MSNVYNERVELIRKKMIEDEVDYYIIFTSDPHGSEYLNDYYKFREYVSSFTGSAGTLVIGKDEAGLWTDGRYFVQAAEQLKDTCISLFKMGEKDVPTICDYLKSKAHGGISVVFDGRMCQASFAKKLEKTKGIYVDAYKDYSCVVWPDRGDIKVSKSYLMDTALSGCARTDKIKALSEYLTINGMDTCVISDLTDVMWLYNLRGSDILYTPVAYSYAVVSKNGSSKLYLYDSTLDNNDIDTLTSDGIEICNYNDFYQDMKEIADKKIVIDEDKTNCTLYSVLSKKNEICNVKSYNYIKKHIKNEKEIELLKKYHISDGLAVTKWIYEIKQRMKNNETISEYEAAKRVDELRGANKDFVEPSFETICATGENGAIVHYSPGEKTSSDIHKDTFLLLDSGGQYLGATTDVTRTIAIGELSDEMKEDYTRVLKGHLALLDAVFLRGCTGENLDILARSALWSEYKDYRHGTGHGVGSFLSVHEGPSRISYKISDSYKANEMTEGMVISCEPGFYNEGKYGIRIENLMLCNKVGESKYGEFLGFTNLTFVPYEADAIIVDMLSDKEKRILNLINKMTYDLYKDELNEDEREWLKSVTMSI